MGKAAEAIVPHKDDFTTLREREVAKFLVKLCDRCYGSEWRQYEVRVPVKSQVVCNGKLSATQFDLTRGAKTCDPPKREPVDTYIIGYQC